MSVNFRLQRLLKYSRGKEEQARRYLKTMIAYQQVKEENLSALQQGYVSFLDTCRDRQEAETIFPSLLGLIENYRSYLREEISRGKQEVATAAARVEIQRNETRSCWQERRVLEKLWERGQNLYRDGERRAEQRFNDELALTRCRRV